ncbi:hypothetical protein I4U23_004134 [Adineta vaga]|nr:hypothetical protein I4U23_004134 [Adineta vaga]
MFASKSHFETLSNELIFNIFDYLSCSDIIDAFQQLNSRFQSLLYSYQQYSFDISTMRDKSKFHSIQQLPINISQIKSLRLCSNQYSCIDIDQYLSFYPMHLHYSTLQLFSFTGTDSNQLRSFIFLLPNFQRLKYLSLSLRKYNCQFHMSNARLNLLRCIILFKIRTLKSFTWNIDSSFFTGKDITISDDKSTIEYYEFKLMCYDDLSWLNLYSRNIKSIAIRNFIFDFNNLKIQRFETITCLKFHDISRFDNIPLLFKRLLCLTQLNHLELEGELGRDDYIFGYQWEHVINTYLSQLKTFRFFFAVDERLVPKPYENLIESFKSNYWLKDKKWFVNSDYLTGYRLFLYTLPCIKKELIYLQPYNRISSSSQSAINVQQLHIDTISTQLFDFKRHFNFIQSLSVYKIDDEVTYEQLNEFLNISSVQKMNIIEKINPTLFCDILKYRSIQISIRVECDYFSDVLNVARSYSPTCLEKINSLTQLTGVSWQSLSGSLYANCSKLKEFIFYGKTSFKIVQQFINVFEHLSFIKIYIERENTDSVEVWLNDRQQAGCLTYKLNDNNVLVWIH